MFNNSFFHSKTVLKNTSLKNFDSYKFTSILPGRVRRVTEVSLGLNQYLI